MHPPGNHFKQKQMKSLIRKTIDQAFNLEKIANIQSIKDSQRFYQSPTPQLPRDCRLQATEEAVSNGLIGKKDSLGLDQSTGAPMRKIYRKDARYAPEGEEWTIICIYARRYGYDVLSKNFDEIIYDYRACMDLKRALSSYRIAPRVIICRYIRTPCIGREAFVAFCRIR